MTYFKPFRVCAIGNVSSNTRNTQLAATIAAFDVPLKWPEPYTVQAGDGIEGIRVTWHFAESAPNGTQTKAMIVAWNDDEWLAANAEHPLAMARRAFRNYREMIEHVRGGPPVCPPLSSTELMTHWTGDTRKAACMEAIGHPMVGYSRSEDWLRWHFRQAAAADLALYDQPDLHLQLPTSSIAYVRASLVNYAEMLKWIKTAQMIRVEHHGRIAVVGVNASKKWVDTLEKLLYRK
jgi:hypothetical protein